MALCHIKCFVFPPYFLPRHIYKRRYFGFRAQLPGHRNRINYSFYSEKNICFKKYLPQKSLIRLRLQTFRPVISTKLLFLFGLLMNPTVIKIIAGRGYKDRREPCSVNPQQPTPPTPPAPPPVSRNLLRSITKTTAEFRTKSSETLPTGVSSQREPLPSTIFRSTSSSY